MYIAMGRTRAELKATGIPKLFKLFKHTGRLKKYGSVIL
jgi:hypothetical protein